MGQSGFGMRHPKKDIHVQRKAQIDAFGAVSLVVFSGVLGFNQVVIKVVNGGFQPVFGAGLRSVGALLVLLIWMRLRGGWSGFSRDTWRDGILIGSFFAIEFICIFLALDLTSVARASVIFYSMPVWMVLGGHLLIATEPLTRRKSLGLAVAFSGVAWAMLDRDAGGQASLIGDLLALAAAVSWAAIALSARVSKLAELRPEMQLFWQLSVSAVILTVLAPLFGPLLRAPTALHISGLAFQILVIAFGGYLFWFWLLKRYPAGSVASFGFLSPVFGVAFGWLLLGEQIGVTIIGALVLVATGLYLINSSGRRPQVPQNVA